MPKASGSLGSALFAWTLWKYVTAKQAKSSAHAETGKGGKSVTRSAFSLGSEKAKPLSEVKYEEFQRVSSGIPELDTVLGGGIVRGSLVLLGGDPGIGKSTLLTQAAAYLSKNHRVLYVSAEESCSQVKMRCDRLELKSDGLLLLNETNLESIEENLDGVEYAVIDSVQAIYTDSLSGAAGSISPTLHVKAAAADNTLMASQMQINTAITLGVCILPADFSIISDI